MPWLNLEIMKDYQPIIFPNQASSKELLIFQIVSTAIKYVQWNPPFVVTRLDATNNTKTCC